MPMDNDGVSRLISITVERDVKVVLPSTTVKILLRSYAPKMTPA